jgi:hypothetical protein
MLATATTVAFWKILTGLAHAGDIVVGVAVICHSAALLAILWFFRTGCVTSILIAFVLWCHLGFMAAALACSLSGEGYDFPNMLFAGVPCVALPVSVLHGVILGCRRERGF